MSKACTTALVHLSGPVMVGCSLLSGPDDPDAAQTQRRSPSPHPEDGVQGAELAGLRSRLGAAGQPDVVDRGGSAGMLADHGAKRASAVYRCGYPDQPDAAHGVQAGVAPDRGPDDISVYVDGPDALSARS